MSQILKYNQVSVRQIVLQNVAFTQPFNLDLILAIGYRVRFPCGVQFRQWASTHLKEHLVKSFVINEKYCRCAGRMD